MSRYYSTQSVASVSVEPTKNSNELPNFIKEESEIEFEVSESEFDVFQKRPGGHVESLIFPSADSVHFRWQIYFYPLGNGKNSTEYSSIYLRLVWKSVKMPVSATYRFLIKTGANTVLDKKGAFVYENYERRGIEAFSKIDDLKGKTCIIHAHVSAEYYKGNTFLNFIAERNLLCDYSSLLESGQFSDLILYVEEDETEFKIHKNILASRSKVFAAMLSTQMQENLTGRIVVKDFSSSVIKKLLQFIYGCEVNFESLQNTFDLIEASDKYDLKDLKLQCAEYLSTVIDENNTSSIILHADTFNLSKLKASVLKYIRVNKGKFSDKEQYKILSEKKSDLLIDIIEEFSEQ